MPSDSFRQRASNCALLTITVICICILVLSGVMIVQEYSLAKFYAPAQCRISNITYAKNDITCRFCESKDKTKEKGASVCVLARLPCIHIDVLYEIHGKNHEALLHPDSIQATNPAQCSFTVCNKHYEDNKREVEQYADKWRKLQASSDRFRCYYNTEKNRTAIVKKMHSKADVIHSMLWPSLVIVVCGIIFLRMEMKRRGLSFCYNGELPPGTAPPPYSIAAHDGRNGATTGTELKQTVLLLPSDDGLIGGGGGSPKVQCSLLKNHAVISSSMPALDKLKPSTPDPYSNKLHVPSSPGRGCYSSLGKDKTIGSSLSVDGLRLHSVRSPLDCDNRTGPVSSGSRSGSGLLSAVPRDKFRHQDSTKTEGGSSTGSQGSKIMGLETPV